MAKNSLRIWVIAGSLALQSVPTHPSILTESLALIEQVAHTPSRAQGISAPTFTNGRPTKPMLVDHYPFRHGTSKSTMQPPDKYSAFECFFNMAEKHNQVQFCEQAGPFEWDCRTHILQQNCGRYSHAQALVEYTTNLQLNVTTLGVAGLIHRCLFFRKSQFNITLCKAASPSRSLPRLGNRSV